MMFTPRQARLVVAGRKTQTRRRIRPGEDRCRYKPGRDYSVQLGAHRTVRTRILIVAVAQVRLGDLTFEEARAEGFRTTDDFYEHWRELHGGIDLEEQVWAITFQADHDEARLLHAHSERGYTRDHREALPDEPEAIDEETHIRVHAGHEDRSRDARARWDAERVAAAGDDPVARLAVAKQIARERGYDPRSDLRVINSRADAIIRKAQRQDEAA